MSQLFSPDSKFMIAASRAADLMILNLLFLVTCIPLVTVGPAVTALYHVVFAMGTHREQGVFREYFRAFRQNFAAGMKLWLLIAAVMAAVIFDLILFSSLGLTLALVPFGILGVLGCLTGALVFPLAAFFDNTTMGTVKNGLVLSLANLPRALGAALLWLFPVIVYWLSPLVFFYTAFLWIVVYFAAAAYVSSLLLRRVLQPWLPEDMFEEDSK